MLARIRNESPRHAKLRRDDVVEVCILLPFAVCYDQAPGQMEFRIGTCEGIVGLGNALIASQKPRYLFRAKFKEKRNELDVARRELGVCNDVLRCAMQRAVSNANFRDSRAIG